MNEEKRCTKCGEVKSIEGFCCDKTQADGLHLICKSCKMKYDKNHRAANPEPRRKQNKEYRTANRFKISLKMARHNARKRGHQFCSATEKELRAAFTGRCFVCGVPEAECTIKLCLDHDHETGNFRGWLCSGCNQAAGLLKNSPQIARILAEYIEQSQKKIIFQ